jgi:hypothetical protein
MLLSNSHGDGPDGVHAHAHVRVDGHDHGDAPGRDAHGAHDVHDSLDHDHRLQTLVADSNHLLVHIAHTSHFQLKVGVAVLNIADAEDSRIVDVDTADVAVAHTDMIVAVVRVECDDSVPVSLQEHHESVQFLRESWRILQAC